MEPFEDIKLTDDPYQLAGGFQILLRRHNKLGKRYVYFWVVSLNEHHSMRIMDLIAQSDTPNPVIEPMEVFIIPKEREMPGIVLVSNHLDGTIELTDWDKAITKRLLMAAQIMRIPILDHVIINEASYYSFKATGQLEKLAKEAAAFLSEHIL